MLDPHVPADESAPDAIIAGTLCLMSCYAQHPAPAYAGRVADNLLRLAAAPALSGEFRAVCRRMAERWTVLPLLHEKLVLQREAQALCDRGVAIADTRVLQ